MAGRARFLCSCALAILSGCQWLAGYEEFSESPPGARHRCAQLPERKLDDHSVMIRVDVPGQLCSWIDQDETTVDQYQRWIDDPSSSTPLWDRDFCAYKQAASRPATDLNDACARDASAAEIQPFASQKPMRCVDWCDAEAFCRWAGKHLCYDNSQYGTQVPRGMPREWTFACNNGQRTLYPWGPDYEGDLCNVDQLARVAPAERGATVAGGSAECASQRGTRDLLGNVSEWTYGCNIVRPADAGTAVPCLTKGGAYPDPLVECVDELTLPNSTRLPTLGFRCCAALTADERLLVTPQ